MNTNSETQNVEVTPEVTAPTAAPAPQQVDSVSAAAYKELAERFEKQQQELQRLAPAHETLTKLQEVFGAKEQAQLSYIEQLEFDRAKAVAEGNAVAFAKLGREIDREKAAMADYQDRIAGEEAINNLFDKDFAEFIDPDKPDYDEDLVTSAAEAAVVIFKKTMKTTGGDKRKSVAKAKEVVNTFFAGKKSASVNQERTQAAVDKHLNARQAQPPEMTGVATGDSDSGASARPQDRSERRNLWKAERLASISG